MASLRRKPRSPFFFACFSLPDGRRTQRSTGKTNRADAMKTAVEWEQASVQRYSEGQFRRVLSDISQQIHGAPIDSPSVSDYFTRWIGAKGLETKAVTVTAYENALKGFLTHLGDRASQPIHYVTKADVSAWRDGVAKKSSPATANIKLKIIRVFFTSAWRDGIISDNPAAKVPTLKSAEAIRRPFTVAQVKILLALADEEWRGLILAGFYTGQRLRDLALLSWNHIDMEQGLVRFATSKTGRNQSIPLARPLRVYLTDLSVNDNPNAPIFPKAHAIASSNKASAQLSRQFSDLLSDAGLVAKQTKAEQNHESTGKGRSTARSRNALSFHSLRHTMTSLLKATGSGEAVAMDIIGHESSAISQHYTHVEDSAKKKAISKLPDITA